jgi:tetratricopeptide (TPR) repeat protein
MKPKIGRNDPCPCGSGHKYKRCCGDKERAIAHGQRVGVQENEGRRTRDDAVPARDDPAEAESSLLAHLALYECLGRTEGMAAVFNNLGVVYQRLGDLAPAEAMYQEALKLEEQLDCKEGIAAVCENLGQIYQARGDRAQAEAMYKQSAAQGKRAHAGRVFGDRSGWHEAALNLSTQTSHD